MRLQFDRFSRKLPIFTSSHMAIIFVKHDSIPLGSENGPTIIKSLTWFAYIRTWENIFSLSKMRRIFAKRKRSVGMETFSSLVCVCRNEGIVFGWTNDRLVHNYRVISKGLAKQNSERKEVRFQNNLYKTQNSKRNLRPKNISRQKLKVISYKIFFFS